MRSALLIILVLLTTGQPSAAEPDQRRLLTGAKPVWYDAQRDDWRRLDIPERRTSSSGNEGLSLPIPIDVVGWLLLTLVAVGAGWLAVQLWRDRGHATTAPGADAGRAAERGPVTDLGALPFGDQGHGDADAALAAALAARDWDRAVVWIYGRLLVRLDQAGVVRLARGTTNRQYLRTTGQWARQDAPRRPVAEALDAAIAAFERTYFGHQGADETLVATLYRQQDAALALLTAGDRR